MDLTHSVYYIHFGGLLPLDGILPGAKFTSRPSLAFSYIVSATARHSNSGRQPNCGVVQGMELRKFRRWHHLYLAAGAAIMWGIGPHSSFRYTSVTVILKMTACTTFLTLNN